MREHFVFQNASPITVEKIHWIRHPTNTLRNFDWCCRVQKYRVPKWKVLVFDSKDNLTVLLQNLIFYMLLFFVFLVYLEILPKRNKKFNAFKSKLTNTLPNEIVHSWDFPSFCLKRCQKSQPMISYCLARKVYPQSSKSYVMLQWWAWLHVVGVWLSFLCNEFPFVKE